MICGIISVGGVSHLQHQSEGRFEHRSEVRGASSHRCRILTGRDIDSAKMRFLSRGILVLLFYLRRSKKLVCALKPQYAHN